ncbi:MAG: ester cyclase [Patescibacteria group bacterium]
MRFKQGIVDLYSVFPDFYGTANSMIIDEIEQSVSIQWIARGTHKGQFMGAARTDRQIYFEGIEILKIAVGQVVERWGEWNGIEILQQIGILGD